MAGGGRPISQAGPDAAKIFVGMGKALKRDRTDILGKAAGRAKIAHVSEIRKASSTMRLRNVGANGSRLGVSYNVKPKGFAMATGLIRATGPMHIIERDTRPHKMVSGPVTLRVHGYGKGFFYRVNHPGTKGKKPWAKGKLKAAPLISKTIRGRSHKTIIANGRL